MKALGITVEELGPDNLHALAELAWFECVELAEKSLPLLIVGTRVLTDGEVERYLKQLFEGNKFPKVSESCRKVSEQ